MKIFEIEEKLKDIESRQKRFEHLLARSSGNIPPLMNPDHMEALLKAFINQIKARESDKLLPQISLIDYSPSHWTYPLLLEKIPVNQSIVPDKRLQDLTNHENPQFNTPQIDAGQFDVIKEKGTDSGNSLKTEFIDMDVIPFALKKTDFLFIPSPYLSDYTLEFPAWLSRISQRVNKGIFISVQFSNEDNLVNDDVKAEGDSQIRSILHKSGFVDVLLLNPSAMATRCHSKYSSASDFYWLDEEKCQDEDRDLMHKSEKKANHDPAKLLIDYREPIPSIYLASRLPLTDEMKH